MYKLVKYKCYKKTHRKITIKRIIRYIINLIKQLNLIKIDKKNLFSKLSELPVKNFGFKLATLGCYILLVVILISLGISFQNWQTWLLIFTVVVNQIVSLNRQEKADLGEMILKTSKDDPIDSVEISKNLDNLK